MRAVLVAGVVLGMAGGAFAQTESGPADAKARKTLEAGMEWVQRHDYGAAVDSFKKANKQDGGHCGECAYKIVKYGMMSGDFRDADAAAQQLIADAKDPMHAGLAHTDRATVLLREGLTEKKADCFAGADKEFQLAMAVYPATADLYFYDGLALAHINQDDAARARFEKYLLLAPKDDVQRERAQRYIDNPGLARARMAPAFAVATMDGQQISLDGLAGKVVLIDFWATWCGPCREALPHIRDIAQRFSGEPLVVLSVSLDNDETAWRNFVAKNGMSWLQYRDGGFNGPVSKLFGVNAIPHTFTIDADGVLQDEHVGDASLEGKLKKLCARARQLQEAPRTAVEPAGD
jgi:thiol-disulfide isomerase/thioredoxin